LGLRLGHRCPFSMSSHTDPREQRDSSVGGRPHPGIREAGRQHGERPWTDRVQQLHPRLRAGATPALPRERHAVPRAIAAPATSTRALPSATPRTAGRRPATHVSRVLRLLTSLLPVPPSPISIHGVADADSEQRRAQRCVAFSARVDQLAGRLPSLLSRRKRSQRHVAGRSRLGRASSTRADDTLTQPRRGEEEPGADGEQELGDLPRSEQVVTSEPSAIAR
jgi:hypothetical protein